MPFAWYLHFLEPKPIRLSLDLSSIKPSALTAPASTCVCESLTYSHTPTHKINSPRIELTNPVLNNLSITYFLGCINPSIRKPLVLSKLNLRFFSNTPIPSRPPALFVLPSTVII